MDDTVAGDATAKTVKTAADDSSAATIAAGSSATDATVAADIRPTRAMVPAEPGLLAVADDPRRYGDMTEHARGGLGRVLRARDQRLGRTVAVKELLGPDDPSLDARFVREALITSRLEHPGIVPVHEAGRWPNGHPYYVMKFLDGKTLGSVIATCKTMQDRLALLPHVVAVADAVGYAHSRGVIHRDLKPANVIVGAFGETVVVDWGLARDLAGNIAEPVSLGGGASGDGDGSLTIVGGAIGTPAYMPPEQARGETVDTHADVYSIGAVLYELFSGVSPYRAPSAQATLDQVIEGPPKSLGEREPHTPPELVTIVSKAMAREPVDRYADASVLAVDLHRYMTGKLVTAHTYSTWSLVRKWLRRHRAAVAVAALAMVVFGVGIVVSMRRIVVERDYAREARTTAERRERELVQVQAQRSVEADPTESLAWLHQFTPRDDVERANVRELASRALAAGVARHVWRTDETVVDARFTPDGKTVVALTQEGKLHAWSVDDGNHRLIGQGPAAPRRLAIETDGTRVWFSGYDGIQLWGLAERSHVVVRARALDLGTRAHSVQIDRAGKRALVIPWQGPGQIVSLDGSAANAIGANDARAVGVASEDWSRYLEVDAAGALVAVTNDGSRPLGRLDDVTHVWMSPRGEAALVLAGQTLWLVGISDGRITRVRDNLSFQGQDLAWSADGRIAAVGTSRETVLIDAVTGGVQLVTGHGEGGAIGVEWSADGRMLTAGDDGTVRVWDRHGVPLRVLRGHTDDVMHARWSPDGRRAVSASLDGSLRVWELAWSPVERGVMVEGIANIVLVGERAAIDMTEGRGTAHWSLTDGTLGLPVPMGPDVARVDSLRDGRTLVVRRRDGSLELDAGGTRRSLLGADDRLAVWVEGRDGAVYAGTESGTLWRWDVASDGVTKRSFDAPIRAIDVAADGRIAIAIGDRVELVQKDGRRATIGAWTGGCKSIRGILRIAGEHVVASACQVTVSLLGNRTRELSNGTFFVVAHAVSASGSRLALALSNRTVQLWDVVSGTLLNTFRGPRDSIQTIAFSPDEKMLAAGSFDMTVWIWDTAGTHHRVLHGHVRAVTHVLWHGNDRLVTASADGAVKLWRAPTLAPSDDAELTTLLGFTTARIVDRRPTSR